jgi:hypothetical protein
VSVSFVVAVNGLEDSGRIVPNMDWLATRSLRRVKVGKRLEAHYLRCRAGHALRLYAKAMTEISPDECVVLVFECWIQKRAGIGALVFQSIRLRDD